MLYLIIIDCLRTIQEGQEPTIVLPVVYKINITIYIVIEDVLLYKSTSSSVFTVSELLTGRVGEVMLAKGQCC
jgi:hypothetical protein